MLNIKRKLSQRGFSLIELMVAIVILALAVFGIFQAYSTGFMGMADARDRTVATNYLREAIEDFKNMDFNQVKSKPISLIPDTKFSRGAYVLNLEVIDEVVTLKKVITQVRWMDRKGNIKTEKVSTIIYNKPATSEDGDEAIELVLYAESYYTILPEYEVNLIAKIKDENGNIFDWDGPIAFSIITAPPNETQVGNIITSQPSQASSGVANCIFEAIAGDDVEGIERIQAAATVNGNYLTDTVNIRVTTGPVGIVIVPASEGDAVLAAGEGVESNINLYVVKADYDYINNPAAYDNPINLSADGPGTLSEATIASVPTEGTSFTLASDGTPGIVEITASAPDLDMGYTEITFTGEPASILVKAEKNSVYPGEDITVTVTIVDVNNVPVEYDGVVNLSVEPNYGIFSPNFLDFGITSLLELESTFTANIDATVGETVTLQANSDGLSGSSEITILSSLTPYYLDIFVHPTSFDLILGEIYPTITATVYDENGTEIVTTYNTDISFIAKDKDGSFFGGFPLNNPENQSPIDGEVEVELFSTTAGTATITASSGSLILRPEGGIEVVFYETAHHIELSAVPDTIEADGNETSIITATVCDANGNRVTNYGNDPDNPKTITLSLTEESQGVFTNGLRTIDLNEFDEGEVTTSLSSTEPGTATVTAESSDGLSDNGFDPIVLTGDIPSILTLGDITNWDDYHISFDLDVSGSPLYLNKINVEWDNSSAVLNNIVIYSPYDEPEGDSLTIPANGSSSPYYNDSIVDTLTTAKKSTINLHFSGSKMKNKNITVTFIDNSDPPNEYEVSFKVPN